MPGTVCWQRAQHWLSIKDGYTGPIDGATGTNTYKAWQRQASHHGCTGPIDGAMGPNSYRAIATFLNSDAWD